MRISDWSSDVCSSDLDDLPHVKRVRSKGRDYYYFDTGTKNDHGKRIYNRLPDIKAPNFGDVYAAMKAGVTRRAEMLPVLTVAGLIRHYERSPEFNRLSGRSEEHTSELQSLMRISYAVFCLKKKKKDMKKVKECYIEQHSRTRKNQTQR